MKLELKMLNTIDIEQNVNKKQKNKKKTNRIGICQLIDND